MIYFYLIFAAALGLGLGLKQWILARPETKCVAAANTAQTKSAPKSKL